VQSSNEPAAALSLAALAAVGLVALEAALAALGRTGAGPALLLAACGLALVPFLPAELRRPAIVVPLVPLLGVMLAAVGVVTVASLGIALNATSVRLLVAAVAVASVVLSAVPRLRPPGADVAPRAPWVDGGALLALAGVVVLAVTLYDAVVGSPPMPGEDWGHYLMYAQAIAEHHTLQLDNPHWMGGGLAFAQDPGAPALYAAFLLVSGLSPGVLVHGLLVFAVLGILSTYVLGSALWGPRAGLVAAALWATLPAVINLLSWHGLATSIALVSFPIVALCAGAALRGWLDWRWALLFGLSGAAVLGAHRLTALVAVVAVVPMLVVALVLRRAPAVRFLAWSAAFGLAFGAGVIVHVLWLRDASGGVVDHTAFLVRKLQWTYSLNDITRLVGILGVLAAVALVIHPRTRRDPALVVLAGLAAGPLLLAYAWVVHLPLDYVRMGYYVAIPLVLAIGVAAAKLLPVRLFALAAIPVVLVAMTAHDVAPRFRAYYQIATPVSLRGLSELDRRASTTKAPIVTDQCWAFLVPWLLQRRSLAALEDWTIPFRQDLAPARQARRILYGGKEGRALARRLGVRFVVVDPKCSSWSNLNLPLTIGGSPIFASTRLLVLDLRGAKS
jgi:hypothetical protein